MKFRCRTLEMMVFEFEAYTVENALDFITDYEKKYNTSIRCFLIPSGERIVGGKLLKTK